MKKLRVLGALAVAGATVVVLSGCWGMSGYTMSKVQFAPGPPKKSKSTVKVMAHPTQQGTGYFFIFTAVGDESGLTFANTGKFDLTKKFGNKPKLLIPNATILDEIVDDDEDCGGVDLTQYEDPISEGEYKVLATPAEFNNNGRIGKQAVSRIVLKQDTLSTTGTNGVQDINDGNPQDILIGVGFWEDADNDGNVDSGLNEDFSCMADPALVNTKFAP